MARPIKFVETRLFIQQIEKLLNQEEYFALREYLAQHPDHAPLIQGTGGARKIRWAAKGKGKSGGIRVLYLYRTQQGDIFFLLAFAKSDQDNLTTEQKKLIKKLIENLKSEIESNGP